MKNFRRYLIAGLLVWLPIGVTVFLVRIMIGLMDRSLLLLPSQFRPENVIGFGIPGLGFLLTIIVLLLTGVLAANFVGKSMVSFGESLLDRIPFVRSIYSATKNFAEIVFSGSGQSFKKVLLIEYPRKGIWAMGFLTGDTKGEVNRKTKNQANYLYGKIPIPVHFLDWKLQKVIEHHPGVHSPKNGDNLPAFLQKS